MPSLFLSYRRGDSPDTVKLIHEHLKQRLPRWEIFYDHQSIPLGEPFPERLRVKVTTATATLVIIGPKWLAILRERVGAEVDHVRVEVQLAIQSGSSVVPVLVNRAAMPTDADLADFPDLLPLLKRNGRPVRPDPDFDSDLEPVIAHLKQLDAGESIGAILADKYTLTAEIGAGGMGVVYAAEQKAPVRRTVAVKLIKPGMDSRDVLARFDAERQALAVMDHPNVAKVLDAGVTASGRPFFVMEYVKGVPITQYCDDKKLTPQERLNLFIPVCNAVQHAHQKGIIHRDLKPSNVLVEVIDSNPIPKVIDFGLAKALGHKLTDKTLYTTVDSRVGTLEYSAPEQAAGRSFDVDTRSDIYSLGVLLYELLTGAPPFTHEELLKVGDEEMRRVIREDEPIKPSKKLSSSGQLPAIAASRNMTPARLPGVVKGDLDWIVMKCLEKERARRYETANQLGEEVRRYLADEPVLAGPPSVTYRAGKFLHRNKGAVFAASLVFLALVGGIIGTSIAFAFAKESAEAEKAARKDADNRLKQIERTHLLLESVFSDLDPHAEEKAGQHLADQLTKLMAKVADKLDEEEIGDPLAIARLQDVLGITLQNLGNPAKAIELHGKALATREKLLISDHLDTLESMNNLAQAYRATGKIPKALKLQKEVYDKFLTKFGLESRKTLISANNLAETYRVDGQLKEVVELHEQLFEKCRDIFGPDDAETLTSMTNLASAYLQIGEWDKSLPLCKKSFSRTEARFGTNHAKTLICMNNLANAYRASGELREALRLYEDSLARSRNTLGPNHSATLTGMSNLALAYQADGQSDKALPLFKDFLAGSKNKFGSANVRYGEVLADVAADLLRYEQYATVEPILRECVDIFAKTAPNSETLFNSKAMLGASLLGQMNYKDAESLLKEGYDGMKASANNSSLKAQARLMEAAQRLVKLYEATDRKGDAAKWAMVVAQYHHWEGKFLTTIHDVGQELKIAGKLDDEAPSLIYQVRLKAGVSYVIVMVSPHPKALDPYLFLRDGKGKTLAENDDFGGGANACIVFRAPADGVYQILAASFNNGRGAFTLTVRPKE